jgi:hypothetical protein
MTRAFGLVVSALFAAATTIAAAQTSEGGGTGDTARPRDGVPQKLDAGQCSGGVCRLRVHATGNCKVTVQPEWVLINAQASRLVWEIDQRDFYFPDFAGVTLKPQYAGSIGGNEGLVLGQKVDSQTWEAYDYNFGPSVARYSVTVVNRNSGTACSVDPGVINDWPN